MGDLQGNRRAMLHQPNKRIITTGEPHCESCRQLDVQRIQEVLSSENRLAEQPTADRLAKGFGVNKDHVPRAIGCRTERAEA